jgi:hypothetical protein
MSDQNFAETYYPQQWRNYVNSATHVKQPMPAIIVKRLTTYATSGSLAGTTMAHIETFFRTGDAASPRFIVACSDFGYTPSELQNMRDNGQTINDVIQEVIARGVRRPADDE